MKRNTDEKYITTDLAITAALSLSFSIETVERISSQKVAFVFLQDKKLNQFVESYLRGEVRVEPQQFFNQLKVIKTRIYSSL